MAVALAGRHLCCVAAVRSDHTVSLAIGRMHTLFVTFRVWIPELGSAVPFAPRGFVPWATATRALF